jgi:hypothetical protein
MTVYGRVKYSYEEAIANGTDSGSLASAIALESLVLAYEALKSIKLNYELQ